MSQKQSADVSAICFALGGGTPVPHRPLSPPAGQMDKLSPEVEVAREAAAAEKQLTKDQAQAEIDTQNQEMEFKSNFVTAQGSTSLSPEVQAARQEATGERQLAKDQAQAEIDAQNQEMEKRLAATTASDSKELSPEVQAARQAAATEKQRAKDQAQAEIDAQNQEMEKRLAATTASDSKELSPEVQAARQAAATEKQRAKDQAQAELDAENKEMKKRLAATTASDSKGLSPEVLVARQAAAAEKQRAKDQAQAELEAQNREMKKRLAATTGKTKAAPGRAGWAKVSASVRFMQSASFAQQREEMVPGDKLALEREHEATRARLHPTEALSGAERDFWQGQAPSAFAVAGTTLEIQGILPMSAPVQGAPPLTAPIAPIAPTAPPLPAVATTPIVPTEPIVPTAPLLPAPTGPIAPRRTAFLGSLSSNGLKFNSQSGMWLPSTLAAPSELDAAVSVTVLGAPDALPRGTSDAGALGAPTAQSLGSKPRGKPPSFGGLSSSGLKFDSATGMWLPPGKEGTVRMPRLGRPPLVGGLSSGGFPGLRCVPRTNPNSSTGTCTCTCTNPRPSPTPNAPGRLSGMTRKLASGCHRARSVAMPSPAGHRWWVASPRAG